MKVRCPRKGCSWKATVPDECMGTRINCEGCQLPFLAVPDVVTVEADGPLELEDLQYTFSVRLEPANHPWILIEVEKKSDGRSLRLLEVKEQFYTLETLDIPEADLSNFEEKMKEFNPLDIRNDQRGAADGMNCWGRYFDSKDRDHNFLSWSPVVGTNQHKFVLALYELAEKLAQEEKSRDILANIPEYFCEK